MISRFKVYKEVKIEHPKNWPKDELILLASDACNSNKLKYCDLQNITANVMYEKIEKVEKNGKISKTKLWLRNA